MVCAIDLMSRLSLGYGINFTVSGLSDAPPDGSVVVRKSDKRIRGVVTAGVAL